LERGIIPRLSSDNILPSPPPSPLVEGRPALPQSPIARGPASYAGGTGGARGEGYGTVFLISRYSPRLTEQGMRQLESFVREGGVLVTNYPTLKPAKLWSRLILQARFYWNALAATITRRPRTLELAWSRGKIIIVFGRMNEQRRNIVHEIPAAIVDLLGSLADLPVDAGGQHGLLCIPQKKAWLFYNTNPDPLVIQLRRKTQGTLVVPDGTRVPVVEGTTPITLAHGAWLELAR
jgi:hypothetical protein